MVGYRLISAEDAYLYNSGEYFHAYNTMGAHRVKLGQKFGVGFVLWAPFAQSVQLIGDFNAWGAADNTADYLMQPLPGGFWQLFVAGMSEGTLYKYRITTTQGKVLDKADPFAFAAEKRPATASVVADIEGFGWQDEEWLEHRRKHSHFTQPLNIYEMHLGSWRRKPATADNPDGFLSYAELAEELPPYLQQMGYTHVEFLPVMEHPFDGSWGYQLTGYYAPTARFGPPQDFMLLVDALHRAGIGVVLDWVPGHFCKDAHGLAEFDGTPLYEAEEHGQWGTYKFNFAKAEVNSFLLSNALFWLDKYHIDGLRVDGVTSMLYLNFGLDDNAPRHYNPDGSEDNKPAVAFLQRFNRLVGQYFPDVFTAAEESTAWPLVTYPPADGGLGFHYKWDMGWMNDTLRYMSMDFPARQHNHNLLTFSMMYAFQENFILALSHDEVVHGKCSLIGRMPGDYWRQFANLRLLYLYQMCHSGAKLNFMGNELAQFIEWRFAGQLDWLLLDYDKHAAYQQFTAALNRLYLQETALWQQNYNWDGFIWQEADNNQQGILIFRRQGREPQDFLLVLLNFQPMSYVDYQIGVPQSGSYQEIFNSDAAMFGGSNKINPQPLMATALPQDKRLHGQKFTLKITVPPLGGCIIKPLG